MTPSGDRRDVGSGGQLRLPPELCSAFDAAPEVRERFDGLPAAHQREYVEWILAARRAEARERRAAQTVMRLLERPPG